MVQVVHKKEKLMRKFCFSVLVVSIILLMVSFSFAQTPREGKSSEGKSTFTNIAVVGLDKNGTNAVTNPGLPGYIEMANTAGNTYYVFIGHDGKLRMASDVAMGRDASPNLVSWADASSVVVGAQ